MQFSKKLKVAHWSRVEYINVESFLSVVHELDQMLTPHNKLHIYTVHMVKSVVVCLLCVCVVFGAAWVMDIRSRSEAASVLCLWRDACWNAILWPPPLGPDTTWEREVEREREMGREYGHDTTLALSFFFHESIKCSHTRTNKNLALHSSDIHVAVYNLIVAIDLGHLEQEPRRYCNSTLSVLVLWFCLC